MFGLFHSSPRVQFVDGAAQNVAKEIPGSCASVISQALHPLLYKKTH
jgi:hypothetical protein